MTVPVSLALTANSQHSFVIEYSGTIVIVMAAGQNQFTGYINTSTTTSRHLKE